MDAPKTLLTTALNDQYWCLSKLRQERATNTETKRKNSSTARSNQGFSYHIRPTKSNET